MNTLGDAAHAAIAKHFHKVAKHEKGVLKDQEPEAIHQMRVGLRRLRTALQVFASVVDLPTGVSIKRVRAIASSLGQVRDLDVLQETLVQKYRPDLPAKEQKLLDKLLKKLQKQRTQALEQAHSHLTSERYQELIQGIKQWLEQPTYTSAATWPLLSVLPDLLLPLVNQFLLHPAWLIGDDPLEMHQSGDILHELRKQAKRVRYPMELFTDFYGQPYQQQVREFAQMQELLGHLHDQVVLAEVLQQELGADLDTDLPALQAQMGQQQADDWREWQHLQRQYLDLEFRHALRQLILDCRSPSPLEPAQSPTRQQPELLPLA